MPPSNSTKKVAKAARSGSAKRASSGRSNRSLTFPAAIAVIVIVGIALIAVGRNRRVSATDDPPRVNIDHWHAAYGIYICGSFQPNLTDRRGDARGVHTHGDGVIHIHPYTAAAAGKKSTLADFFYEEKLTVTDSKLELPGGETWENGKACPDTGKPGHVVLAKWASADDTTAAPEIITKDIGGVRFTNDRMAFTLAFVPDDEVASLPRPESIPTLDNLTDVPGGATSAPATSAPAPGATTGTSTGDTVNPGESPSSTAPGETTTAPGSTSSSGATSSSAATATTAAASSTTAASG